MRISLRQLDVFRAVALSGSTTAAAVAMNLSQSAASAALLELESALGVRLFDRVGKRVHLNEVGRKMLPTALSVLDGARTIETSFGPDATTLGQLRVVSSTTIGNYVMPALLARTELGSTLSHFELQIGNTQDAVAAIQAYRADVGLIEGPCHSADIIVHPWLDDELVIVAAARDPLAAAARKRRLDADRLAAARWLLREPGSGTREAVEQALLPFLTQWRSMLTLGSSEAIKNAVAEGLGISCLSRVVVADLLAAKRLAILSTRLPRLTRRFTVITHRDKVLSPPLARFMQQCTAFAALAQMSAIAN